MATSCWKKVTSQFASKQKSNSGAIEFLKDNRDKREKKSKRKRGGVGVGKWPSRWRPTRIDLRRYYPKIAVSHSGKIK